MIKTHEFVVEGHGTFPLDMLRYDACWPTRSEDIANMNPEGRDHLNVYRVHLRTALNKYPTEGRWRSFGWRVVEWNGKKQ